MIDVSLFGVQLRLLSGGGVFLVQQDALLVADLHLGKEATFRRHGIPVPVGATDGTLQLVDGMLRQCRASRLVVLGDLFHARSSLSPQVQDSFSLFLDLHADIEMTLVRGNHDRSVGCLPSEWKIESAGDQMHLGDVTLTHEPLTSSHARLSICGHIHPSYRVPGAGQSVGALPCFWLSGCQLMLPAAGQFTGTYRAQPKSNDRVWVIADEAITEWKVPPNSV